MTAIELLLFLFLTYERHSRADIDGYLGFFAGLSRTLWDWKFFRRNWSFVWLNYEFAVNVSYLPNILPIIAVSEIPPLPLVPPDFPAVRTHTG